MVGLSQKQTTNLVQGLKQRPGCLSRLFLHERDTHAQVRPCTLKPAYWVRTSNDPLLSLVSTVILTGDFAWAAARRAESPAAEIGQAIAS